MTITTRMTEIEAVNLMLSAIGESPVNSIEDPVLPDVATAKRELDNQCRALQNKGWDFNTDKAFVLTPDSVFNKITLPANTLKVNPVDPSQDFVQRGSFLYDRDNNSYTFTAPVKVNITSLLPFSELPAHAQQLVLIRAARKFQNGVAGAGKYDLSDEQMALVDFRAIESEIADHNVLRDTPSINYGMDRYA